MSYRVLFLNQVSYEMTATPIFFTSQRRRDLSENRKCRLETETWESLSPAVSPGPEQGPLSKEESLTSGILLCRQPKEMGPPLTCHGNVESNIQGMEERVQKVREM